LKLQALDPFRQPGRALIGMDHNQRPPLRQHGEHGGDVTRPVPSDETDWCIVGDPGNLQCLIEADGDCLDQALFGFAGSLDYEFV
jgi:hypothetical protein